MAKKKIRLGMVRCDTHAHYFSMFMQKFDAVRMMEVNKIVHYYATDWYDPSRCIIPQVPGLEVAACYDADIAVAEEFSGVYCGKPKVCKNPSEMADHVDAVFIADCDGGGGDHLKLARPFLKMGIPTFVDKPFASTLKDAKAMIRLAEKHKAPLLNSSILSQVPIANAFRNRLAEILPEAANWTELSQAAIGMGCKPEGITRIHGVVKGVGGAISQENQGKRGESSGIEERLAYIIHGIALSLNIFGKGVSWVEAMGGEALEYLHLHLNNGNDVIILNPSIDVFPERCSFFVEAYSKLGAIHSEPIGDPHFLRGGHRILQLLEKMVRTGKAPIAYADILEHIAIVDAAQIAQRSGDRVMIADVMKSKVTL